MTKRTTLSLHITAIQPGDLLEDTRDEFYLEISQIDGDLLTYHYSPHGLPTFTHQDTLDTSASDGYLPAHWRRADRREFNAYAKRLARLTT